MFNQKNDLASQIAAMEQFCLARGIAVDDWIKEIGGGMNFKRKAFLSLMSRIQLGEIKLLIIACKDRLIRFGFDYFQTMAQNNGCEIIILNQEYLSPQQEMVEDLMAILHTFSGRLHELKTYKKVLKDAFTQPKNTMKITRTVKSEIKICIKRCKNKCNNLILFVETFGNVMVELMVLD